MFKGGAAKNRDFCVYYANEKTEKEFIDAQCSIEDKRCPENKDFVRATCFYSGTRVIAETPNHLKVYYVGQIDLGGWVPAMIGNKINLGQPLVIGKIRDYAAKKLGESK